MLLLASSLWMLVSCFFDSCHHKESRKASRAFLLAAIVVADALNPKPFRV